MAVLDAAARLGHTHQNSRKRAGRGHKSECMSPRFYANLVANFNPPPREHRDARLRVLLSRVTMRVKSEATPERLGVLAKRSLVFDIISASVPVELWVETH